MLNSNGIPAGDPTGWYVDKHGMVRYEPDLAVKRRLCLDNLISLLGHSFESNILTGVFEHKAQGDEEFRIKLNVMQDIIGYPYVPAPPVELKREYTI